MSDLLEKPTPRVTRRKRQEMSNEMTWSLEVTLPQLTVLEKISKDPKRIDEGYRTIEKLLRTFLRRAKFRLRPKEDAFDYFIRKSVSLLIGAETAGRRDKEAAADCAVDRSA